MTVQLHAPITDLQNHLLVATPALTSPAFAETVIYLAHHGKDGGMGFVINQPLPKLAFTDVAKSMGIEEILAQGREQPVMYRGGPVESTRGFVLHSADYKLGSSVLLNDEMVLSAQADIVTDIARGTGPRDMTFCLGYAGWAPGQLEDELHGNDWLLLPANPDLVFKVPPAERYALACRMVGLDPLRFHPEVVGQA